MTSSTKSSIDVHCEKITTLTGGSLLYSPRVRNSSVGVAHGDSFLSQSGKTLTRVDLILWRSGVRSSFLLSNAYPRAIWPWNTLNSLLIDTNCDYFQHLSFQQGSHLLMRAPNLLDCIKLLYDPFLNTEVIQCNKAGLKAKQRSTSIE